MASPVPRGTGVEAVARRGRATRGALTAASTGPPLPIAGPRPFDAAKSLHSNRPRAKYSKPNRKPQHGSQ